MPTTLNSGLQLPDKGSVDWYSSMQNNYNLLDNHLENTDIHVTAEDKANWNSKQGSLSQAQLDAIAQVATNTSDIATLQSGKANASHTHSSSDITDIGDYATKQYVDNSISGLVDSAPNALDTLNELAAALNDDANFASTVTTALSAKANSADLATVATSGSYNDLSNKPTINDSTITIQKNGSTVDTFTTNGSNKTINISVPTKTSDLTNDSNFVDTSNSAVASGITSAKVTSYDSHIADTDIHVTTADKTKWNNQTYVFRYSSTALVASSTNSNTLLDNTDNLKVGDKVIDSSGVLFSITAIDSVNSTFTVGSALIDLALDGNVVHTSGNETVGGEKTFDAGQINVKSTIQEIGVIPQTSTLQYMPFMDKNNVIHGLVGLWDYDNGASEIQLNISDIFKNGVKDKTGTLDTSFFSFGFLSTGVKFTTFGGQLNNSLIPLVNSTYDVGSSSYKWKSVYGTNYYYGSNNVEFSTKFVTTDTNQTINGTKTFTDLLVYNSDTTAYATYLNLKNQRNVRGSNETGVQGIQYQDKNNKTLTMLESRVISNGNTGFNIICYNTDGNNQSVSDGVSVIKSKTDTCFAPTTDNAVTCGRPLAKWSDVQTYLVNGLTPSSLSMPDLNNGIDISSYITVVNNANKESLYTPPANGWISVRLSRTSGALGVLLIQGNMASSGKNVETESGVTTADAMLPVVGGVQVSINSALADDVVSAYFYPCQGNV